MKTLKNAPYLMTVICNIQNMNRYIHGKVYDSTKEFKKLEKLTEDQLYTMQENLIPEYNNAVKIQNQPTQA